MASTQSINVPEIRTDAAALANNPGRQGWRIQNLGTNPLFVALGTTASTTVFHYLLAASLVQDDGTGGSAAQLQGAVYYGPITVAGTSPRYVVMEM